MFKEKDCKEQDFQHLIEECTNALREGGYSEQNISIHQRNWKRIRIFMDERFLNYYSAPIGELFLDTVSEKNAASRHTYRRSTYLLTDYLFCGKIRKNIVQHINYELPGRIGSAAEDFLASLSAMRRCHRTIKEHRRLLSYFVKHLSIRSINEVREIKEEDVLSFISSTENCKDRRLYTMRLFCRYLYRQGLLEKDIEYVIGRNPYPVREKLPSIYDAVEIQAIESSIDQASPVGKRDYAVILLATRLGLRASDIASLEFDNLDWDRNIIRLTQCKTKREIELPLLANVGEAIVNYLKFGRPVSVSQNVFLTANAPYRTIDGLLVSSIVRRHIYSSKVDVRNRKIGSHAMRHSLASQLLCKGTTLPVISDVLGHANTQTTMTYLRVDMKALMNCTLKVPIVSTDFYNQKGGIFYE